MTRFSWCHKQDCRKPTSHPLFGDKSITRILMQGQVCWVQSWRILTQKRHLFIEEQKTKVTRIVNVVHLCPLLIWHPILLLDLTIIMTNTNDDQEQPSQPRSTLSTILAWSSLPPKKLILSAINLKVANFRHFSPWRTFRPGFNLLAPHFIICIFEEKKNLQVQNVYKCIMAHL